MSLSPVRERWIPPKRSPSPSGFPFPGVAMIDRRLERRLKRRDESNMNARAVETGS
jgi:hypothetical protein